MDKIVLVKFIILSILLLISIINDLKYRKIPNKITAPFLVIGLVFNLAIDFPKGAFESLIGIALGFFVFFIPYVMKAMGAGDVKLMAAIGAITKGYTVFYIALFTAIVGGLITIGWKAAEGGVSRTLKRTAFLVVFYFLSIIHYLIPLPSIEARREKFRIDTSDKQNDYIPYSIAIAGGCIVTLILSTMGVIQGLFI